MTATTQQGAAEGKDQSLRADVMSSIAARRQAELAGSLADLEGNPVELTADDQIDSQLSDDDNPDDIAAEAARKKLEAGGNLDDDPDGGAGKPAAKPSAAGDAGETIVLDPSQLKKYKLRGKVDGEEQEISLDRALAVLQKDAATERRLAEATAMKREAEELLARARANPGDDDAKAAAEAAGKKAEDLEAEVSEHVETALASLAEGDTKAATQHLTKVLLKGRTTATPDVDTLVRTVESRLKTNTVLADYRDAYPEVAASPALSRIADTYFDEAVAAGKSQRDALMGAGEKTREFIKSQAGEYGMVERKGSPTSERSERIKTRKTGMDPEPSAAGMPKGADAAPPTETESRASAIEEMAAQREKIRTTRLGR